MYQPQFRDKQELNGLLAERGLHLPEYREDLPHIRDSLIYSMVAVLQLQKELVESGREPNLEFLVNQEELNPNADLDWGKMNGSQ